MIRSQSRNQKQDQKRNQKRNQRQIQSQTKIFLTLGLVFFLLGGCDLTNKDVQKLNPPVAQPGDPGTPGDGNDNNDNIATPKDSDGDGLSDDEEADLGTNPKKADTDGDGLSDGEEVNTHGSDPNLKDTDGGGINDGTEVGRGTSPVTAGDDIIVGANLDADNDGLIDEVEIALGTDPNVRDSDGDGLSDGAEVNTFFTDPLDPDTDNGSISDGDEVALGTKPLDGSDDAVSIQDSDEDGLSDSAERAAGTDPRDADSDGDGLLDGVEVNTIGSNPLDNDSDDGGVFDGTEVDRGTSPIDVVDDVLDGLDSDGDGLTDIQEIVLGTASDDSDSDGDGLSDGAEVLTHLTNPLIADTDSGGEEDGSEIANGRNPLNGLDDNPFVPLTITFVSAPSTESVLTSGAFVVRTGNSARIDEMKCAIDPAAESDFTNCDENVAFSFAGLTLGSHSFVVQVVDTSGFLHVAEFLWTISEPPEVDVCEGGTKTIETVNVSFAKTTVTCAFNSLGNLPKKNRFISARKRQEVIVGLPEDAKLCGVEFVFADQKFKFDDHFALAWNDIAIATNADYVLSDGDDGFKVYDFDAVKGNEWGNTDVPFCLGQDAGTTCSVPAHASGKTFKLSLDQNVVAQLVALFNEQPNQVFSLDIIGDNDGSDCKHHGLSFDVKVTFAE